MQNYKNIKEEMKGWVTKLVLGQKAEKTYQRDPHSILDETLLAIWFLLLICIVFTISFGAYFHYKQLSSAFGAGVWATVGSFGIFFVIEIVTVVFGLAIARILFSGLWFKSFLHLAFMVLLGTITVSGFRWSINISTKGIADVNASIKNQDRLSKNFTPSAAVDSIDRKIALLDNDKKAGAKSTWKGRTTKEGLEVINDATKLQSDLVKQREMTLKFEQAAFDSLQLLEKKRIAGVSELLSDYGGRAEYAKIILILLVVILEFINFKKNTTAQQPAQPQPAQQPTQQQPTQPNPTQPPTQNPIVWNQSQQRQIGFTIGNTGNTACNTSSVATQSPTQSPTQPPTQPPAQSSTKILFTPSEDISKLKNYTREYYRRSFKATSLPGTLEANRKKYQEYRRLLELAGYQVVEHPTTLLLDINPASA